MQSRFITALLGSGFLLCAFFGGCRPADPLDWKIDAETPEAYNDWVEKEVALMPRPLADEFNQAATQLMALTPRIHPITSSADMLSKHDPFCQQVNRRTVRAVIIDSYQSANQALFSKVSLEQGNALATLKRSNELSADDPAQPRFEVAIRNQRKLIDFYNEQIRKNEARIAALKGQPAPPAPAATP
ncbi:MAG: hypothetical protein JSS11_17460 [Verrucomicrobia bacterium]|nr:hypothetical protein [Verrucomicrobiota bacterium]